MADQALRDRTATIVAELARSAPADRGEIVERLVVANMAVARSVARRYTRRTDLGADLEQVAYLALVRAAQDYDPARGYEFLAYAIPCVTGAVKRYFRDSIWVVRPPRRVQVQHQAHLHWDEHVADGVAVETCFRPRSLDISQAGDSVPLGSTLVDPSDRTWETTEARLLLAPHLDALPERARRVLHLRFVEDRTQQEIADELGVSQMHVSRLLRRYVGELRARMTDAA